MTSPADYIAYGLALVPILTGEKRPYLGDWNKPENVVTDFADVDTITGNVGLAHAYCIPSISMSLDLDHMALAVQWLAARGIDVASLLNAENAVQIISGKSDRAKLIYRLPINVTPLASTTIKKLVTVDGKAKPVTVLEFRCATRDGLTVQDVLPPSIHPDTGQPYRWGGKGDWRTIPEIPSELLKVWQQELAARQIGRTCRKSRLALFKAVEDTPRQRARVADMLRHVSADCDYERYRDMVWAILSLGWVDAEDIADQWCQTAPSRYEEANFWNVVNSYDSYRTPTIGTIHHYAKEGGWNG